jgi:predicted TIM-barrel fold metal-dependent hydrolase
MPSGVGIIDLMLGIPNGHEEDWYEFLKPQLREESKDYEFPVQYMFKEVPHLASDVDHVTETLKLMDRYGIEKAMVGVGFDRTEDLRAVEQHPDRFIASFSVDPNRGMDAVRDLVKAYETIGIKAAMAFPAGYLPQVPINDKRFYPLYAKCIELDIPICVCTGICGPRVPSACQETMLIDEVCWYFPELKFVMRHGAEPWADLAVKLMLKWPNLYYSTSAFAPRYYPQAIVDYANSRGADKVMYAGYFPMGLSLDRIFRELPNVGFKDEVWPKFLRENAIRVFGLDR